MNRLWFHFEFLEVYLSQRTIIALCGNLHYGPQDALLKFQFFPRQYDDDDVPWDGQSRRM